MEDVCGKLTVFFEEPFWVGLFERTQGESLCVSKVTFGAEPKDCEVLAYVLEHYHELTFSPPVPNEIRERADNPKRRQRAAAKEMQNTGVGTRSQQALQAQREMMKVARKVVTKEERESEAQRRFEAWKAQKDAKNGKISQAEADKKAAAARALHNQEIAHFE